MRSGPDRDGGVVLVYSCSGCSAAAQTANWLAVRLDRLHLAQMSCIAGVGGDVRPLVRLARSGRPILAIDGCPLDCARHCLARHDVIPTVHHRLSDAGVRKDPGGDIDQQRAEDLLRDLMPVVERLRAAAVG